MSIYLYRCTGNNKQQVVLAHTKTGAARECMRRCGFWPDRVELIGETGEAA